MPRRASLVATVVLTLVLVAPAATAAPPTRIPFEVDLTLPRSLLSALCGVPVFLHVEGAGTVFLFHDQSGNVIRELDTVPGGFHFTFFSPVEAGGTGKSLTVAQYGTAMYRYPEGTDVGDPAIVSMVGTAHTPGGDRTTAGRQVAEGIIIGQSPEGIPIVAPVAIISESGIFPDPASVLAKRCAVLTDP